MTKIIGDFLQAYPPDHDSLELSFSPVSEHIKSRCRHQTLSAHFIADYFASFLPVNGNGPEEQQRIKEIKGAISYISNELLENAMKFNLETAVHNVKLGVHFLDNPELIAVLFATNSVESAVAEKLQTFIQQLLTSDPAELYMRQVEASAEDENAEVSGLGLLTMIHDYEAKLGWKLEVVQSDPEILTVTTMARISV